MREIPLVSVCLITYNQEKYIEETLNGLLAQEIIYSMELVVADDFSTDKTRDIIREFCKNFPHNVKLIFQKKNVGPADNFFDLMSYPKSKYIAYLEGDDYWIDPLKLQKQIDYLENNPEDFGASHNVKHFYENWNSAYAVKNNPGFELKQGFHETHNGERLEGSITLSEILNGWPIASSSFVFRREVLDNYPDFFRDTTLGDQFLFSLVNKHGNIHYMPDQMSVYRIHKGGINGRVGEDIGFYQNRIDSMQALYEFYSKTRGDIFKPIMSMCHFQIAIISKSKKERLHHLLKGIGAEKIALFTKTRMILSIFVRTFIKRG